MSKETRTIRPFVGLAGVESILEEAVVYFGQEPCLAGQSMVSDLAPHEFLLRPVRLHWAPDQEAHDIFRERLLDEVVRTDMAPEELSLVAVASSPYLKLSDIVLKHPVADLDFLERVQELTGDPRQRVFSTPYNGFSADL